MPDAKNDALKLAIDDFLAKEASVRGELESCEQQIRQLESQIESANERLGHVAEDRQKILDIMSRYVTQTPQAEPQAEPQAKPKAESKTEPAKAAQTKPAAQASGPIIKPPPPKPAKPPEPQAKEEEPKAEGDDDTVKNINDALRGLFR